jgi:hypothetical protein
MAAWKDSKLITKITYNMKGLKLLMVSAETSAIVGLGIALFKCASDGMIDYMQAAIIAVLAASAITIQSIQQEIKW